MEKFEFDPQRLHESLNQAFDELPVQKVNTSHNH